MRRRFVIGDIHGCSRALTRLVERLGLCSDDEVVLLGDLVDRGPDSAWVLETLLEIEQTCPVQLVLGNHEEMLLAALEGRQVSFWLRHGGNETLTSYRGSLENFPDRHRDRLVRSVDYLETEREILIHANLEPEVPLPQQSADWLRWQHLTGFEYEHSSGRRVICGHSGIGKNLPRSKDGWICLDTLVHRGGYLTCLEMESNEIAQASEAGEFRCGISLSDLP